MNRKIKKIAFLILCLTPLIKHNAVAQNQSPVTLKVLIEQSISSSEQIAMQNAISHKARLDKQKALLSYLPKITVEASVTHLNDDVALPDDMVKLLMATQGLLFKEAYGLPFNSPYPPVFAPQKVPPLQSQNIKKAGVQGQMLLFSGMKVPYLAKAANHQMKMSELLEEQDKSEIVKNVLITYDRLVVIYKSEEVLNSTELFLNEQERFVLKAKANGLATDLDLSKIELAKQQLQSKRIQLLNGKQMLTARLAQLSNIPAERIMEIKADWTLTLYQQPNVDVSTRSDIQALDQAILAMKYKHHADLADYTPKVIAFGKKEFYTNDLSAFDPEWYVGIGVKWSVFDGLSAAKTAQKSKLDRLILQNKKQEAIELLTLKQQQNSFEIEKDIKLTDVARQQVNTTKKAFETSEKQYKYGLISLKDHLESVSDLEAAQLLLIEAKYQTRVAVINQYEIAGILYDTTIKKL